MALDFNLAIDPAFAVYGEDATYTPPAGAPVAVRVIRTRAPLEQPSFTRGGVMIAASDQGGARAFDVRASEVAIAAVNATLTIGAQVYTVKTEPRLDEERKVWTLVVGKPEAAP